MNDLWVQVSETIAAEFSDVPDAAQATRIVVRLGMAALLGGLLGYAIFLQLKMGLEPCPLCIFQRIARHR